MADTPSLLLQAVSEKLIFRHGDDPTNIDLKKLLLTLTFIRTWIREAEEKLLLGSESGRVLLKKVEEAAYEVDDLLDKVNYFSSSSSHFRNPLHIFGIKKIVKITEKLGFLHAAMAEMYGGVGAVRVEEERRVNQSSWLDESEFYVRMDEKMEIISLLLDDNEEELSVIPIVGMGGLGKSTLARMAFNDERVINHFELRSWVLVPESFDVSVIAQMIIESAMGITGDLLDVDPVEDRLLQMLIRKKFLIVLDDVWNEDYEKWDTLKSLLEKCNWGCKVIVTTRNEKVAKTMGTVIPLHLDILSDDDCWCLFKHRAFSDMFGEETPEFLEIDKKIVQKCKGFPVAAKSLGVLMHSKRTKTEWLCVNDDEFWNLEIYEPYILPSLKLSYNRLPSHLKQCFAYCSIFPKGYTIKKDKLIQLWMAEGFILSYESSTITLDDIGNDYFMDLLARLLFTDAKEDDCGNIIECKMHDFIHGLAQSVVQIGCTIVEAGVVENLSKEVCHLSLVCNSTSSTIPKAIYEAENLRTLLLLHAKNLKKIPINLFSCFRCLRVLDLSRTGIRKLSVSIGSLKNLRYLDLSHTSIETLPGSIIDLKDLQTLKLLECYRLKELPKDLREMTNLRHLDIRLCFSLVHMPSGIGQLSCLCKLPLFIVDKNNQCSLRELHGLNLGGKLEIKNLEYVTNTTDAFGANLKEKQNLSTLGLSWGNDVGNDVEVGLEVFPDEVLEGLQPHSNLRELDITEYKGVNFPTWMMNSLLLNLVKVSITNCKSCEHLPPLGQLPYLQDLYVKGMDAVKFIGYEFYGDGFVRGFPSLKRLEFYNMPNLVEWFSLTEIDEQLNLIVTKTFPCLSTLIFEGCPKLTSFPSFPVLKDLALWNSNETLLCSLDNLTSLSSLVVNEFRELRYLPKKLGNLISIKKLTVYCCNRLVSLSEEGMQGLTSLQHLRILYCNKLYFLNMGLRYLRALMKLNIQECRELTFLPDVMEHLPLLEELIIDGCPELASLPNDMQYLTSLQKLIIKRCPKLEYLPIGFERIFTLQYLLICACPLLERRLERDIGEEWWKIAHVPTILINNSYVDQ